MPTTDHALAEGSIAQVSGEGGEKGGRSGLDAGPGRPRRESVREICSPAQLFFLPRPIARRFAENESEYQLAPLALQNLRRTQLPQAIWDARNDLQWKENFIQRLKLPGTAATPTTDDETIERFYAEGIGTGTESKSACSLAKRELIRFLRRRIQQRSRRNVECSLRRGFARSWSLRNPGPSFLVQSCSAPERCQGSSIPTSCSSPLQTSRRQTRRRPSALLRRASPQYPCFPPRSQVLVMPYTAPQFLRQPSSLWLLSI